MWMRFELQEYVNIFSNFYELSYELHTYEPLYLKARKNCEDLYEKKEIEYLPSINNEKISLNKVFTYRSSCLNNFLALTKDSKNTYKNNKKICNEILPKINVLIN